MTAAKLEEISKRALEAKNMRQNLSKTDDFLEVKKVNKALSDHTQAIFQKYQELKLNGNEQPMSNVDKAFILRNCEGLVNSLARKFISYSKSSKEMMHDSFDFEDLVAAGKVGLLQAIDGYDVTNKGKATFFTYAYFPVKQQIRHQIYFNKNTIRLPYRKRDDPKHKYLYIDLYQPGIDRQILKMNESEPGNFEDEDAFTYFYSLID